jgi:hypothetical protein
MIVAIRKTVSSSDFLGQDACISRGAYEALCEAKEVVIERRVIQAPRGRHLPGGDIVGQSKKFGLGWFEGETLVFSTWE